MFRRAPLKDIGRRFFTFTCKQSELESLEKQFALLRQDPEHQKSLDTMHARAQIKLSNPKKFGLQEVKFEKKVLDKINEAIVQTRKHSIY